MKKHILIFFLFTLSFTLSLRYLELRLENLPCASLTLTNKCIAEAATEPIFASAILLLQQQGKLGLQDDSHIVHVEQDPSQGLIAGYRVFTWPPMGGGNPVPITLQSNQASSTTKTTSSSLSPQWQEIPVYDTELDAIETSRKTPAYSDTASDETIDFKAMLDISGNSTAQNSSPVSQDSSPKIKINSTDSLFPALPGIGPNDKFAIHALGDLQGNLLAAKTFNANNDNFISRAIPIFMAPVDTDPAAGQVLVAILGGSPLGNLFDPDNKILGKPISTFEAYCLRGRSNTSRTEYKYK